MKLSALDGVFPANERALELLESNWDACVLYFLSKGSKVQASEFLVEAVRNSNLTILLI